jgi:hypothetical protein
MITPTLPFDAAVNSSVPAVDRPRLTGQCRRVYDSLISADEGLWLTLYGIGYLIKANFDVIDSEASISARLRDLKNLHGFKIEKRRRTKGQFEYRLNRDFLEVK